MNKPNINATSIDLGEVVVTETRGYSSAVTVSTEAITVITHDRDTWKKLALDADAKVKVLEARPVPVDAARAEAAEIRVKQLEEALTSESGRSRAAVERAEALEAQLQLMTNELHTAQRRSKP